MPQASSTGTSSISAPNSRAIQATLSSSSSRLNVQVLYINRPPGFKAGQISERMRRWRCQQMSTFSKLHSSTATWSLRNMPSPEQGTSVRITSNKWVRSVKSAGSLFVTTTSGCPHFIKFSANICERFRITSLATNKLPSGKALRQRVDFPPGAAQRSSITTGSCTYSRSTRSTNIDEASCT